MKGVHNNEEIQFAVCVNTLYFFNASGEEAEHEEKKKTVDYFTLKVYVTSLTSYYILIQSSGCQYTTALVSALQV